VIKNVIKASFQAPQIIFEMQSQGISQKKVVKKICSYKLKNVLFFKKIFLTPLTFKPHNLLISYLF
jgi:hypothetical protein